MTEKAQERLRQPLKPRGINAQAKSLSRPGKEFEKTCCQSPNNIKQLPQHALSETAGKPLTHYGSVDSTRKILDSIPWYRYPEGIEFKGHTQQLKTLPDTPSTKTYKRKANSEDKNSMAKRRCLEARNDMDSSASAELNSDLHIPPVQAIRYPDLSSDTMSTTSSQYESATEEPAQIASDQSSHLVTPQTNAGVIPSNDQTYNTILTTSEWKSSGKLSRIEVAGNNEEDWDKTEGGLAPSPLYPDLLDFGPLQACLRASSDADDEDGSDSEGGSSEESSTDDDNPNNRDSSEEEAGFTQSSMPPTPIPKTEPELCQEQKDLVNLIMSGANVFYTGSAGWVNRLC